MPKYDTLIKYINNGSVISESKLTIPLEEITQEKINIGMELILRIHTQEPVNAHVKIMQGKRTLKRFDYFMLCEDTEDEFMQKAYSALNHEDYGPGDGAMFHRDALQMKEKIKNGYNPENLNDIPPGNDGYW